MMHAIGCTLIQIQTFTMISFLGMEQRQTVGEAGNDPLPS